MGDKYKGQASATSFGTSGAALTPANSDLADFAKAVVVTDVSGGAVLEVLPVDNADAAFVTFTGVTVGFQPPYRVRQVGTGTTCTVASVTDG